LAVARKPDSSYPLIVEVLSSKFLVAYINVNVTHVIWNIFSICTIT
jgi:hypothetical protein